MITAQTASIIELPASFTVANAVDPFNESLDLQQQAEKIENAVLGFYQNTLDRLIRLGNVLNKFLNECIDKLGEKKGKAAFEEWLKAGKFGATKYLAKAAMEISCCFSELSEEWKEVARKNVNIWSTGALKALAKAAKCSVILLQALLKREGNVTEKLITNVTNLAEGKKPNFSRGEFVEIAIDDDRQLKGKLGKVADKDEYGNIIVSPLDGGLEVKLQKQDLVKKTSKAITEPLLETIEQLRESNDLLKEEQAQKEQELSKLKLAVASSLTDESYSEEAHDRIVVEPILIDHQEHPDLPNQTQTAELANANAKIENLTQTIEKLTQQLDDKEQLIQTIENLQYQLRQEKMKTLQPEEHDQTEQKYNVDSRGVVEVQSTYSFEATTEEKFIPAAAELLSDHTDEVKETAENQVEEERQELNPYKVAFAAFVNLDLQTVNKEYDSKPVVELIATLETVSEKKKTVMPSLSPDELNEVQFQMLAIHAEALKAEIVELTETQQEKVRRIREIEMFESDQKARKEARTVVKKLAESNLYKDQIESTYRGFAKATLPSRKR